MFFFLRLYSRSRNLGFPKLAHKAILLIVMLRQFELSRFYRLLVISKINSGMPKFANKTNATTRSREAPTIFYF